MDWYAYPLLILAGIAAGFVNMLAGNGSLITLPALLLSGCRQRRETRPTASA